MFKLAEGINKGLLVFYLYRGRVDKDDLSVIRNYSNAFRVYSRVNIKLSTYIEGKLISNFNNVYELITYLDIILSNIRRYKSGEVKELPYSRRSTVLLDDWLTDANSYRVNHKQYTKLIHTKLTKIGDELSEVNPSVRHYHMGGLRPVFDSFRSLSSSITIIL